jgi:hypothetical protein
MFNEFLEKARELAKDKVDHDKDGKKHPKQYFEGLSPEVARKREKEIERRQAHKEKTGEDIYGPLPGDEEIEKKKKKQNKGTKSAKASKVREEIKKPGKKEFIRAASKVSGVSRSIIEEVYDKGLKAAATSGRRPGQTPQSWARARVYAFLFDSKSGARKADKYLWDRHKKKSVQMDAAKKVMEKHSEVLEKLAKGETYIAPKSVAAAARRAIKAKEEHGSKVKGGTSVGWTRARQLADRKPLSEDTIKRMHSFFSRHSGNEAHHPKHKDFPWADAGYTAWAIWGGDPGRDWAKMMVERFKKRDEKK